MRAPLYNRENISKKGTYNSSNFSESFEGIRQLGSVYLAMMQTCTYLQITIQVTTVDSNKAIGLNRHV